MKRLAAVIMLLGVCVLAQERKPAGVPDFSLGLNTASNPIRLEPGWSTIANNVDFTKSIGGVGGRDGYDLAVQMFGSDSILWNGLIPVNWYGGEKQLLVVTDSLGAPFANIHGSRKNSLDFDIPNATDPDTFWLTPDSAYGDSVAAANGSAVYYAEFRLRRGALQSYRRWVIDTATSPDVIIDSVAAWIPAVTCGISVSQSANGDTIIIVETTPIDLGVYTINFWNIFDGGPSPLIVSWAHTNTITPSLRRIATRFAAEGQLSWAQFRNLVYITTDVARGVVYDGRVSREYPLRAPGEISTVPVPGQGNIGAGSYRYVLKYASREDTLSDTILSNALGVLGAEVTVSDSSGVGLWNFPRPTPDAFRDWDTVTIEIWRTTGRFGVLDQLDTVWNTGITIRVTNTTMFDTLVVIDTLSDEQIVAAGEGRIFWDGKWYDTYLDTTLVVGADTVPRSYARPGAVGYMRDTVLADSGWWAGGAKDWAVAAGWAWMVVVVDTNFLIPSDSGPTLSIFQHSSPFSYMVSKSTDSLQLSFARNNFEGAWLRMPSISDSAVQCLLYRGPIVAATLDSLRGSFTRRGSINGNPFVIRSEQYFYLSDSFYVNDFYLVGTYSPGDTVLDTLRYDSLLGREPWRRNVVPSRIKKIATIGNRLAATDGLHMYVSDNSISSGVRFDVLEQVPVAPYTGDEIVTFWQQGEGLIKVATHRQVFNMYEVDDVWRVEYAASYGCVAPFSHVAGPEGDWFLSENAVRLEEPGIYKERSIVQGNKSPQLRNFRDMTIDVKARSFAVYYDNKYILSMPERDTTFVGNVVERDDGTIHVAWSTWTNVPMTAAAFYRVDSSRTRYPGDSLYFASPGSNEIYRMTRSDLDVTEPVNWELLTGLLAPLDGFEYQVATAGVLTASTDTLSSNIAVDFYTQDDELVSPLQVALGRVDTTVYHQFECAAAEPALGWKARIYTNHPVGKTEQSGETTVEGLILELVRSNPYPLQ